MAQVEMKKTLGLTGVTINAMALIAPGAFLWLTYQMQAAQVDLAGETTAMDMFAGLVLALILAFLTAISYSKLSELYPQAGTGSSYYFTEQAILNESRISPLARLSKFVVGWFSHLYYWVYPGVMVAMMATLITYIFSQFGVDLSMFWQMATAVIFAFLVGYIAYRGINGSTISNTVINVIQIIALIVVTILALVYRATNPEHVTFVHPTLSSVVMPHNFSNVMFQATIAILLLVGFESATALTAESKSPKHVSRGVMISLVIQGLIMYLFEYFGANAWINTAYTGKDAKDAVVTGIGAAAASSAPIGDMVKNLGDALLGNMGFALMIIVACSVGIAVVGTTLACMNTGVRVTYAMSKDKEVPEFPRVSASQTCDPPRRRMGNDHCIGGYRRIWSSFGRQPDSHYLLVKHRHVHSLRNDQPHCVCGVLAASAAKCAHSHRGSDPRHYRQYRHAVCGPLSGDPRRGRYSDCRNVFDHWHSGMACSRYCLSVRSKRQDPEKNHRRTCRN